MAKAEEYEVIWLPTYSPDLNSIERYWVKLKKVHRETVPNPIGLVINPWTSLSKYALTLQGKSALVSRGLAICVLLFLIKDLSSASPLATLH